MKKILISLAVLLLIIVIAMTVFVGKLDGLIAEAMEKYGSEAIGTSVQVGKVKTDLQAGTLNISSINVANPTKYTEAYALEVDAFVAKVDYDKKEIAEIIINEPTINAEFLGVENNFDDIIKGLPAADGAEADESGDELELMIQTLKLLSANVNLKSDELGAQNFVMDDFVMHNIRGTSSQIAKSIVDRLTQHIAKQTNHFLQQKAKQEVKKQAIKKAQEVLSEKLDDLKLKLK